MKRSFYIYSSGEIKRKDNTLQFQTLEGDKRDIPIEQINDIYLMSELKLNTNFINFIARHGVLLHFFNYYSFYTGSFVPKESLPAGNLLVQQVLHHQDIIKRLTIAKKLVAAAADNMYRNMRYYNERSKDLSKQMEQVDSLRNLIDRTTSIEELMGIEGNIKKSYYSAWESIITQQINFKKRVKNPPDNMINTLISFVNTLVYTRVLTEMYHTQLNPTVSYLHVPGVRRFSLCLDIAEIFKPLIGDRLIFSMLNKNQITEKDFTKELNFLHLKKNISQKLMQEFDNRLKITVKHRDLKRDVSYEYLIRLECYKLVNHLLEVKEYEGFRIWW